LLRTGWFQERIRA